MKNREYLKKYLMQILIVVIVFLISFIFISKLEYNEYKKNFNYKINDIFLFLEEKYPDITKEDLIEILNSDNSKTNILEEYGNEKYTWDNLLHALFDELGELNHELKAKWCWWKKTQEPVDREKLLEEYVDCIHFGLCMILKRKGNLALK